jgi:HSP20 family protein
MFLRWEPFTSFDELRNSVNLLLGTSSEASAPGRSAGWSPSVDVFEDEEGYRLEAELPGLSREDVELELEDRTLSLRGERKPLKDVKRESYHVAERPIGRFVRTFNLPTGVDRQKISATFQNGVLTVALPKGDEVRPRKIKVQAA